MHAYWTIRWPAIRRGTAWGAAAVKLALAAGSLAGGGGGAAARVVEIDPPAPGQVLTGKSAFGDWRQDAPGVRRHIRASDLPQPGPEKAAEAKVVPIPEGASPKVPAGFQVEMIASKLAQPRAARVGPGGELFVSNSKAGEVLVLTPPAAGSTPGTAWSKHVFVSGLKKPYGIAFYPADDPKWVYIGVNDGVVRTPYRAAATLDGSGAKAEVQTLISGLPTAHHWTRDVLFTPDGVRLLLAVGSGSNAAQDMFPEPRDEGGLERWKRERALGEAWDTEENRAVILSYTPEGQDRRVYATGLRNPSGITLQPGTNRVWAVVNERDGLGDDGPFEYATAVQEGAFYGWPWYAIGNHQDPRHKGQRADLADKVTVPDVLLQAHSAVLQIAFCEGDAFPPEYKGSAFVTMHGSWDRSKRTGYKVVRVLFDGQGNATGEYEDFMTGFVVDDQRVWGRPVGVAVGRDGSLFVTEDGSGTIWRVTFGAVAGR